MSETNPALDTLDGIVTLETFTTDDNTYMINIEFAFHDTLHYNQEDFYNTIVHQLDEDGYAIGCPESDTHNTLKQAYQAYNKTCKKYNNMDVV